MKILFDYASYQANSVIGGGEEYGNVVLEHLLSRTNNNGLLCLYNKPINESLIKKVEEANWMIYPILDLREVVNIVKKEKVEKIYSPLPYSSQWEWVGKNCCARFIGTFHGVREIENAQFVQSEKIWFESNIQDNDNFIYKGNKSEQITAIKKYGKSLLGFSNRQIITDSEYSKAAIMYYFPEMKEKEIVVLYPPYKKIDVKVNKDDYLDTLKIEEKQFALILGGGIFYKNPLRAALAFDNLFDNKYEQIPEEYKVVITGIKNADTYLTRLLHPEKFVLLDYVEANDLEELYKNAHMLVYPSLNEGFGYPPIEAMKYGTVCACSAGTSIAEICGNMAVYFNPFLINEIAAAILKCFSETVRGDLLNRMKAGLPIVNEKQKKDLEKLIDIIIG